MSLDSAPETYEYLFSHALRNPKLDASLGMHPPARSVVGVNPLKFDHKKRSNRRRKLTEKEKAFKLEMKSS